MENEKGEILYIGKAKNLAKRVINYTSLNNLTRRLQRMVSLTSRMNFVVTNTEIEALLLECNLIKRHKPRFNIILRDDKSFPYILINKEHTFPRIQKYRGTKKFKGDYYGPFVSPSVADYTLISLQKTFLLRSCSEGTFNNRSRPCLLYDIKRCSAPCVNYISEKDYLESIEDANKFLGGDTKKIEKKKRRVIAVGTTSLRAIESCRPHAEYKDKWFETDLFIKDGFKFNFVNGLITNFHSPESTLLMLVAAFADHDFIKLAYKEAKKKNYGFLSYGDCMLII